MRCMLVLMLLAVLAAPSRAEPEAGMAGTWRASGGSVVTIPEGSGWFNLVFVLADGERVMHTAQWVVPGREFTWTDKQGSLHTATLQTEKKPERIKDVNSASKSVAYWYRQS